jgi:hypothetical protein
VDTEGWNFNDPSKPGQEETTPQACVPPQRPDTDAFLNASSQDNTPSSITKRSSNVRKSFGYQRAFYVQPTLNVIERVTIMNNAASMDTHGILFRFRQKAARIAIVRFGWKKAQKDLKA